MAKRGGLGAQTRRDIASGKLTKRNSAPKKKKKETTAPQASSSSNRGGIGAQTRRDIESGNLTRQSRNAPGAVQVRHHEESSAPQFRRSNINSNINTNEYSDWRKSLRQRQKENNWQSQLRSAAEKRATRYEPGKYSGAKYSQNKTIGEQLPGRNNYREHRLEDSFDKALETNEAKWNSTSRTTGYFSAGGARQYYVKDKKGNWKESTFEAFDKQNRNDEKEAEKYRKLAISDPTAYARLKYADKKKSIDDKVAQYKSMTITEDNYKEAEKLYNEINKETDEYNKLMENAADLKDPRADWDNYSFGSRAWDTIKGTAKGRLIDAAYSLYNFGNPEAITKAFSSRNEWIEKYQGNPEAQYEDYLKGLQKIDKVARKNDMEIQKSQAHIGNVGKFSLETLGAVTGMGIDIGAGAVTKMGTIPMMMLSASGGAARQANTDDFGQNKLMNAYEMGGREAAEEQQMRSRIYGAVTGAIEGMSEKIFAVGAPMQKLVGKGAISGDKIARTFARRLAKTDAGRELVTAFSKAGISMSGEGFEEVVAGVLEPIADKMIVNKDKDLDWGQIAKDSFHDAMIGGAIGGLFGGAEIANQYQQGKFVKADVGSEELVKKGLRASEKSEAHEIASQLKDQVEQTGTINAFEAQALAQALESPENDAERRRKYVEAERKTSQTIIDDYGEKAVYAGSVKDEYNARKAYRESNQNISEEELDDGTTNLDQVKEYENTVSETMQAMEEKLLGSRVGDEYTVDEEEQALSDEDRGMVEKVAEAVANISVGEASYEDYQMFTEVDPVARESIEEVLGITLPEGNDATVDALIELNMNNRLDTFGNKVEEGVVAVARQQLGKEGYPVFVQEMKNHNVSKDDYATAYKVYAYFYDAGVDGSVPYHKVPVPALDALQEGRIKESFLRAAYINGRTEAKQNQEKRESKVRKAKKKKSASFVDETSAEFNAGLSARKAKTLDGLREALKGLSEAWGVTIHLVDPAVLGGANGTYSGGVITISADTDQPLLETFTHEFMHRMEKLAPKQWKAYCDFVKQKMNEKDPGSFSRAVSRQLKLYDKSAKTRLKDRNDAIFEVVAESTKALFVDENFVNDLARQDASLASKIASVLRDMFEALKQVIERLNWYRAKQNEFSALFSDMETLEKAKDLWLAAAEAQMTNEVVEQSDGKQYKIRIGMSDEERYEELKDKTIHLCDYNHDAIESIPAGIMRRFAMAKRREARTDMRSFAESLGVIGKTFTRDGGDLTATFTSNNYKESFSQQMNIASDERLVQFAKMLTCMEDIVESAEEIERHNPGKENEDKDLKEIRVFVSAFRDDGFVIPVKLLVKEYFEKEDGLYVTMTLDKIKETALHDQSHNEHRSLTISDYKLSELLGEVKKNGNRALAKYIPEQFAKDSAKSNGQKSLKDLDSDYMAAVEAGDMKKAQEMVDQAAERAGYKYKGYHGTIDNFNVFSKELQGRNWDGDSRLGKGFYFAFDEHTAQEWTEGTRVVSAFLHMRKPLDLRREAPKDIIARIDAYIDRKIDSYDESYPISREQFVKNVRRIQEIYKNDPGTFLDQFKYDDYGEMTDGIRELLEEMGYDGIIAEDEMVVFESNQIKSADPVTYDDAGNVIPLSERFNTESDDIRFSLEDNKGKTLTAAQQEFFRNVAPELKDEQGRLKRYYHGTGRADRVGYFFDPERATSGPMAFFTDDEEIATNYSRDKADTSLAYENEDANNYYNQFVVDVDGEEVNLLDYWHYLSPQQKAEFSERAGQITRDWDNDYDSFVLEEGNTKGNGGYAQDPYTVRQARGNVFRMLEDAWLWSGDLFNEEEEFLKILDLLGVENARYKDPNYREEKVYEVYLNITHPLVTSEIDEEFADDLEDWLDSTDLESYTRETADADFWDKNNWDPYEWLDKLRDDIANGTTYAWTSIPDAVTAFMKEYGDGYEPYDGIVDTGGKYHDAGHQVVIPFYSNQIKNIDNENPTEDEDIRYSIIDDYTDNQGRHYDQIVLTDSKIFEGKNFRGREKALHDFVYNKLSGTGTFAYDDNGNSQYIEFAKENERVRKSGAKNSHKVLDKLAKKQNIVDQYAVAHATELIEVSRPDEGNEHAKEHSHQWLDENGWDYRKVYLLTTDGKILEAILNIGVARDGRKILYDVNKINTVGDGVVPHNSGAAKTSNGENNVAQTETESNTKRQLSLNDYVSLSPEMLNSLISEYAIPGATTNNYSKAWIATIDPRDFLRLTLPDETLATWQNGTENAWGQEVRELDVEDLKNARQVPYLIIDTDESHSVIGHEGRHRMLALMRAGYTNIPVVIRDMSESSKRSKESMETMDLWPQDFGDGPVNGADTWVEAFDVIPIREQNRAQIEDTYGTDGKVQFSMQDSEGNALTPAQQRYFENSQARDRDGRLAVVYHSTNKGGFTIFDSVWSDDEISFFFTSNRAMSESYMSGRSNDIDPYSFTASNVEINTTEDAIDFIRNLDPDIYGPEIYHLENGKDPEEFYDVDRYIEKYGTDDPGMLIEVFDDVGYSVGEGKNWIEAAKDVQDGLRDNDPREHKNIEGTYSAYLNLKDPLIIECEGSSWSEIREPGFDSHFVSFDGEHYYIDGTSMPWDFDDLDAYGEAFQKSVELWKEYSDPDFWDWGDEVFTFNGEPFNAIEEGSPMSGNTRYWCEYAQDLGYDGVIFRDLYDNGAFGSGYEQGDVYVAFDSNQIKDIRNENPTDDPDIRFSFAGEDALNADNMMLQIAKNMDENGEDSEKIRQFTGWHKGYDDKWRFEMDDSQMKLSKNKKLWQKPGATLGDVLEHPILFANYPQLRKMKVGYGTAATLGRNVFGGFNPITKTLYLANKAFLEGEAETTTMHEVQHAIQSIEGFANGANSRVMSGRQVPPDVLDLARQSAWILEPHLREYGVALARTLEGVKQDLPAVLMQAVANDDYATIEAANAFLAAMRTLEEANTETTFGRYQRAAGEIEARDVEARLGYSEEMRRGRRPDIDRKNALLRNDIGEDLVKPKASFKESSQWSLRETPEDVDPEMAHLYEKIEELRSQMRLSKGTLLSDKDARNLVKELFDMPGYVGKAKLNETIKRVKKIFALLAKDETMDEGLSEAMRLAREIVDNSVDEESSLTDEAVDQLNAVRAWLKQSRIYIPKEQKADISADWGDWYRSHKKIFPHLMARPENGIELDRWLLEFNEQFPGIIDEARISPADQFLDVANWVESMENDREVLVDSSHPYYNEMVNSVASVIFDRMDQAVPAKNFADRKQAEKKAAVEKERDKSKQRTAKLREKKNAEKDAAVERTKEHYRQLIKEIREEKNMSTEQKLRRRMQKEQERDRKRRDRQQRRNLRGRIERDAKDLSNMLLKPTEKKHIPFGYDKAIAKMLNSLDFETQYSDAWIEKYGKPSKRVMDLRDLREQYAKIVASDTTEIEANEYMLMMIESLAIKTEGMRLSELDTRTLSEVRTLVAAIKFQISHINQAFTDDIQQTISELGDATIEYFNGLKDQTISGGAVGRARDFVNVTNAKPIDFFDRVGSPLQTVFQEIVKGEDTHIRNIQAVKQYIEEIKKKYGKNAFDTWSGEKAEAQTFDLSDGSSIELTPAQVMSLYALNRREQARGHMYASGIVVAPVQRNMKNKLKKKLFGDKLMKTHVHVTYADVIKITSQMTKEQKEVADAFLRFLNGQCAEWGNQTSMRLYGYESFREKNYFPIKSSEMFLNESTSEKQNAISKLKNTGFTKATVEYADNPIVIDDFFRVCANHINTMSMYNAFVPAITDFERVYNYNDRSGRGIESSVKQSINRKMGNAVNNYINTLLQDLNTQYNKDQNGLTIADELLRRWKSVKIGANARVLVQQPTAITRAQVYIDYKYLAQSLATNANPATASKTKKRMWDTCPIAYWKHLGFAQTDVSREMQDIIMGNEDSKWNRLAFGTYGFADDVAWTRIFGAVEAETRAKHPELREGSREWKEHVNERFRYIVDRTQVVDSTLHRSQIMRSKDFFMRSLTSFMAEPTTQINMWMTMLKTARDQISSGDKSGAARTMTRFGQNYLISMITLSVAASLISAMRDSWTGDDDDKWKDKPFIEKWLKHYAIEDFKGNINLLNQLPYVKDIMSVANGYEVKRADLSLVADAITSVRKFKEYFDKDGDVKYSWKKLALDAAEDCAALFGVPVGNLEKDIMASRKAFFNVMKDADYAHFKEDSFELNPAKNKSKFIEYYLNSLEKGNDETSDEIKKFLNDNDISDDDIDKVIKKRLNSEVNAAIDEEKPEKIKRILDKYKKNYDYTSEDVMKKVRTYFNEDLKSAIEDADADKIKKIMKDQKKYGMSSDEVEENVHYWTNRYYKKALEADNTDKLDNYDKILRIAGMSKDEIYLNRGNYYIGYYDMLIYNAGSQAEKRKLARKVARLFPDMTDEEYIMDFVSTTESKQNLSNWPKGKWTKASISKRRNR